MTSIGMFRERQESRVMTLDYSFNDIEPIWIRGGLPFGKTETRKVKVQAVRYNEFRIFHRPCSKWRFALRCQARRGRTISLALLLTYPYGTVPLNVSPPREGFWSENSRFNDLRSDSHPIA